MVGYGIKSMVGLRPGFLKDSFICDASDALQLDSILGILVFHFADPEG